ncbi:MAG: hypothetical protein AL399_07665 [Candidatus [Bacteroides] periocalifornicus]|uniref:Shikimate kinase n=1 Tax=Candidatus [Bacteroides] periocalifornicus TaxID=1702214 RepID=A0A0Q4B647_9BACT|nr:MAG: hypothetical protein AL399_07665 [Candidatus [Bacteroides] periocalifornicus]
MNGILSEKGIAFPVFLIGFMGSGKSTLGSWLAARLNVDFVDLDRLVEACEGMPIPLIFAQRGEEAFRVAERRALLDFCQQGRRVVVSTGGGAPCYRDNLLHMQRAGTTVYLQLAAEELATRLRGVQAERPLLAGVLPEALAGHVGTMLAAREPYYSQADLVVEAGVGGIPDIGEQVLRLLLG